MQARTLLKIRDIDYPATLRPITVTPLPWCCLLRLWPHAAAACRMPHASCLIPHTSYLIPDASYLIPDASYLMPHASYLIPHTSYLIPRTSYLLMPDASCCGLMPWQKHACLQREENSIHYRYACHCSLRIAVVGGRC